MFLVYWTYNRNKIISFTFLSIEIYYTNPSCWVLNLLNPDLKCKHNKIEGKKTLV